MKREELKELGIDEETVNKVMEKYGASVNDFKTQIDTLKEEKGTLEAEKTALTTTAADYETQMESLKAEAGNNTALQERLDTLKSERDTWEAKAQEGVQQTTIDLKTELALTKAKARNPHIVLPLIDREALKLDDDGNLVGIDEQIEKIQQEDGYLFATDDISGAASTPPKKDYNPGGGQQGNPGRTSTPAEKARSKAAELWPDKFKEEDN